MNPERARVALDSVHEPNLKRTREAYTAACKRHAQLEIDLKKAKEEIATTGEAYRDAEKIVRELEHITDRKCSAKKQEKLARFTSRWVYCEHPGKNTCEECKAVLCGVHFRTHTCEIVF